MRYRFPTIYDVAKLSGVSISTVSRVLNAPQQVKEKTRNKVLDAIRELGFVPKADASARARKDFGRIGVLTPFFTSPSFVQRIGGIAAALDRTKYELIIYSVESYAQLEGYLAMLPVSRRLDGLIIISLSIDDASANRLRNNKLETVFIEYDHPAFSGIDIDNERGGRMAAQHLVARGYRRCAFLGDAGDQVYSLHPSDQRLEGFKQGLEEAGFELPEDYICLKPFCREEVVEQAGTLLDLNEPPEAIFAASDLQAIGVLRAVRQRGMKVPDDVAVIGFDDLDYAAFMELTTINQELKESGRLAAELLLARIQDGSRPIQKIMLPLTLKERSST
jgi:DNA-binding LacI/PurR family transcriptional regulator